MQFKQPKLIFFYEPFQCGFTAFLSQQEELSTLLLLGVVGSDLVDGRPLASQQRHLLGRHVQLVNASNAVLVPEQKVLIVAKTKGVVQLLPLIHRLASQRTDRAGLRLHFNREMQRTFFSYGTRYNYTKH